MAYSYASQSAGLVGRAREVADLFRAARADPAARVNWVKRVHQLTKERVREHTGVELKGKRMLDIGPGQQLGCLKCFSVDNDVTAIDLDVIPQGNGVLDYARMLRSNGPTRTLKTLGRRVLGVDSYFDRELAASLGVPGFQKLNVLQMSATAMTFPEGSFDFVYSHSVFEHIPSPERALDEVARVLRPGGVAYISVHIYTSHSGQHDPKILTSGHPTPPLWPHLRPAHEHTVHPNAWVNRVTLAEWKDLFPRAMPGVFLYNERQDEEIGDGLKELRAAGELEQYTDEELMTVCLVGIWRKT